MDEDGVRYLVGLDIKGEVLAYSLDGEERFALEYSLEMRYMLDYFHQEVI